MTNMTRGIVDDAYDPVTAPSYSEPNGGTKYGRRARNSAEFEGLDIAGFVGGVAITLGPLAAYAIGWGA